MTTLGNDPFDQFDISSHEPLEGLKRSTCPKCKGSRMYFCYTCFCYVDGVPMNRLPQVKLPVPIDIIKHPKELDGKSTAVHAALLAPNDVRIYTYPTFPNYGNENMNSLLVFPGPDAEPMKELLTKLSTRKRKNRDTSEEDSSKRLRIDCTTTENGNSSSTVASSNDKPPKSCIPSNLDKIIMIDSTWNQVRSIASDQRLKGIPRVELKERNTMYWRRQHNSPSTYLSTIEALYCFVKQYHELCIGTYDKRYDDLLYFFKFFYQMVHKSKRKAKS